jgi:glycosyltransferase involved in cell wall biosynthesis
MNNAGERHRPALNVLYIHHAGVFGGASRSLLELIEGFPHGTVTPHLITQRGNVGQFFAKRGIEVIETIGISQFDNTRFNHYRGKRWLLLLREAFYLPFTLAALIRARLKWKRIDLVHVNEIVSLAAIVFSRLLFDCPVVVHVRSVQDSRHYRLRGRFLRATLRRNADAVVAIDETVRRSLPPGIESDVVHNTYSAEYGKPGATSTEPPLPPRAPGMLRVAMVGSALAFKGVREFVGAARLCKERGLPVEFLMVGVNPNASLGVARRVLKAVGFTHDAGDEVRRFIQDHGLEHTVRLLGFTPDIDRIYGNIDVLCFPSHLDAVGRPVIEAAFFKVPSIVALNEPLSDTLVHGTTGLRVDPEDARGLADAIEHFCQQASEIQRMGQAAYEHALCYFDSAKNAAQMLEIYGRLLARRGARRATLLRPMTSGGQFGVSPTLAPPVALPTKSLRILIISYYFPPLNKIASHRPYSWAKTWSALGHDVHVLTPAKHAFDGSLDLDYDLNGFSVHIAPFLGRTHSSRLTLSSPEVTTRAQFWNRIKVETRRMRLGLGMFAEIASLAYFSLVSAGQRVLSAEQFDLIVSTSPPEVAHFAAHALSKRTGVPWIADYRDLWFPEMRVYQFRWAAALTGLASRRLLRDARLVSTVSQGLASRLKAFLGRDIHICYNGFTEHLPQDRGRRPWQDDRIHIVYTGALYPDKRNPEIFLRALGRALRVIPALERRLVIDIYSYDEPWLRRQVDQYGVAGCVRMHGFVSYSESIHAQRHANYLLFVDWMDDKAEGILTGKLFEYLDSGRPILCIGTQEHSEAARLIRSVRAGVVLTGDGPIQNFLEAMPGSAPLDLPLRDQVRQYSREEQAKTFLDAIWPAIRA